MADGCACLYGDYDGEQNEFYHEKVLTARKQYHCCECGAVISPGQRYERATGKSDGRIWNKKTCLPCSEIRNEFYCGGGWTFESLWEDMREQAFPSLTMCCLMPLSIEAQRKLVDRYSDWQEDLDDED